MPQSQTAANPRHQEEEKKDKNIHAQNKQTNKCTRNTKTNSLFPKRGDQNAKTNGETRTKNTIRLKKTKKQTKKNNNKKQKQKKKQKKKQAPRGINHNATQN